MKLQEEKFSYIDNFYKYQTSYSFYGETNIRAGKYIVRPGFFTPFNQDHPLMDHLFSILICPLLSVYELISFIYTVLSTFFMLIMFGIFFLCLEPNKFFPFIKNNLMNMTVFGITAHITTITTLVIIYRALRIPLDFVKEIVSLGTRGLATLFLRESDVKDQDHLVQMF